MGKYFRTNESNNAFIILVIINYYTFYENDL